MFPDAVQVRVKAGSAVPFDARGIHRGLKRPGKSRRSLFFVYGVPAEVKHSAIIEWAKDPIYQEKAYLASLPGPLRESIEVTLETCSLARDS